MIPSVLSEDTRAFLRKHGKEPTHPTFSNMILAELWEAEHTRGSFTILKTNEATFAVFERGRPVGQGGRGVFRELRAAVERLNELDSRARSLAR